MLPMAVKRAESRGAMVLWQQDQTSAESRGATVLWQQDQTLAESRGATVLWQQDQTSAESRGATVLWQQDQTSAEGCRRAQGTCHAGEHQRARCTSSSITVRAPAAAATAGIRGVQLAAKVSRQPRLSCGLWKC